MRGRPPRLGTGATQPPQRVRARGAGPGTGRAAARGAQPETNGLLGRVYKDQWKEALAAGRTAQARGLLDRAIKTYRAGFEADWRDHYPGINALQLMVQRDPEDPEIAALLPVLRYAVNRKIGRGHGDYWDYATALELAVLAADAAAAHAALAQALAEKTEPWMLKTTRETLEMLVAGWEKRGMETGWVRELVRELEG